jgi:hypothetical protein
MKKAFLLSFILAISFLAAAQDTVRYLDPWYSFEDRGTLVESTWFTISPNGIYTPLSYTDSHYIANVIPVGKYKWLYGIAVTLKDTNAYGNASDYSTIILHAYLDVTLTPSIYSNQQTWTHNQELTLRANRSNVKECMFEYEYDYPAPSSAFSHCYEFYFDQPVPIAMEESNFVGIVITYGLYELFFAWDSSALTNYIKFIHNDLSSDTGNYFCVEPDYIHVWGGIFPIVELRCTAPRGFRLCDEVAPTACWRGDTNATVFQVSVCNSLIEPELGSLATTSDTSYDLSYLHPDSAYMVYLRKMCSFVCADTVWSDWSGPIVLGDTTGWAANGAGIGEAAEPEVTLTPNPAADRVTVAAEGMERVELIGVDGTVLLRRDCRSECQIDLTGLAAGLYLVRATTPRGTATRSLVVAR